jgi:predicted MFS family arabinose efflux permease
VIETVFGGVGMIVQLAFLDLAAKSCPRYAEATFFALFMSVSNGGTQLSENVGARLYDWYGYTPLVLIAAGMTALAWVFVPLVRIERIEVRAREAETAEPA